MAQSNVFQLTDMKLEKPLSEYNGKPEIDDGHTKIANELLDAIIGHDFSKRQLKILLFIMRKTYGWNKSEDDIARSQLMEATGLLNPHITTALQELQAENVVIITNGKHAKRYKINKYYNEWRVSNLVTITESVTVTESVINDYQNGNSALPKQYPQKTTPKYNSKDTRKNINSAQKMFDLFWSAYPKKKSKGDAEKAFKAINPDSETFEQILLAIEMQKQTNDWVNDGGKYIKYPATWLRDKAWLDELSIESNSDLMAGVI
ncbi:MAG: hypothetical protein CTY38_06040 [Methylotenera sp.]|uniref:replication protein n=1 Tax=Methylotenera sp. TaxID=2051956 RepID=UPI000D419D90|nr:replication protein [Methylotenera sp.]PPC82611.1 MAG: hypothetical protein CTY38_06040 [Methylotenera sp.]